MEETQAASNPNWKQDQQRALWRERRWKVRMFIWGIIWKVLFAIRLAKPFSRMLCRLSLYQKYSLGGRCHYCGEVHGMHWKIKEPNYGGINKINVADLLDYDSENVWHVTPTNDLKEHSEDVKKPCECNPKYQVQDNKALIIVHNSYDHREWNEKDRVLRRVV